MYKKAIELNPRNDKAYRGLGWYYARLAKHKEAEEMYKKAIELNPRNDKAYHGLARCYEHLDKIKEAEEMYKKAIEINPRDSGAYQQLGDRYSNRAMYSQAEEMLKKSIEINPRVCYVYMLLAYCLRMQGKYTETEKMLKKAIEIIPENDRLYGGLVTCYEELHAYYSAEEYSRKADNLRLKYYNPKTLRNHRRLKEILDQKGIQLVCVQYPMRSIEPLKKMFNDTGGIIFVDNEQIFKQVVREAGYNEYFTDNFAGDFGHCTPKGNRLLAENIVNIILKEYFKID